MSLSMRIVIVCFALFMMNWPSSAQDKPSVAFSKIHPPRTVPEAITKVLSHESTRVTLGKQSVTIWLRNEWPVKPKSILPQLPESLRPGAFVGVVEFAQPWLDFRGLELPAGIFSLRYSRQPKSADHEDTSPSLDFLLLCPVGDDQDIKDLSFAELKKRSGKSTGGTHPAAMVLLPVTKREVGLFRPKESWIGLQWKWNTEAGEGKLAAVIFGVWNGK